MDRPHVEIQLNTVWRISDQDVRSLIEDRYPLLSESETQKAIQLAHDKFSIDDWADQIDDFIAVYMNTHIKDKD